MAPWFTNDTCDPFHPISKPCTLGDFVRYAVNVSEPEHISKALKFVTEHNIRLVIRNTGHEYAYFPFSYCTSRRLLVLATTESQQELAHSPFGHTISKILKSKTTRMHTILGKPLSLELAYRESKRTLQPKRKVFGWSAASAQVWALPVATAKVEDTQL